MSTAAMSYEMTFGDRLRRTRLELGLDQRTMADALNIHHATISRYERDGHTIDKPTKRLAALVQLRYGVSADWLLYGTTPDQWAPWDSNPQPTVNASRHLWAVAA
jgi:transcriptional regulator with XRE-family HTH domain